MSMRVCGGDTVRRLQKGYSSGIYQFHCDTCMEPDQWYPSYGKDKCPLKYPVEDPPGLKITTLSERFLEEEPLSDLPRLLWNLENRTLAPQGQEERERWPNVYERDGVWNVHGRVLPYSFVFWLSGPLEVVQPYINAVERAKQHPAYKIALEDQAHDEWEQAKMFKAYSLCAENGIRTRFSTLSPRSEYEQALAISGVSYEVPVNPYGRSQRYDTPRKHLPTVMKAHGLSKLTWAVTEITRFTAGDISNVEMRDMTMRAKGIGPIPGDIFYPAYLLSKEIAEVGFYTCENGVTTVTPLPAEYTMTGAR